jgi:hypothetical protein
MILFQFNNIIILSLIIFYLNYNQHKIDTRHFEIRQHRTELSTTLRIYSKRIGLAARHSSSSRRPLVCQQHMILFFKKHSTEFSTPTHTSTMSLPCISIFSAIEADIDTRTNTTTYQYFKLSFFLIGESKLDFESMNESP